MDAATAPRRRHGHGLLPTFMRLLFVSSLLLVNGVFCKVFPDAQYDTIGVSSLLPASSCKPSPKHKGDAKSSSLKVVHRHGPCAPSVRGKSSTTRPQPTHEDILRHDQSRVDSINSRFNSKTTSPVWPDLTSSSVWPDGVRDSKATNIPAKSGSTVGSGNYVVTVGLGTPKRDLTLIFDTGSDLTWTQCKPCVRYCYSQREAIFDPTLSPSYLNISCSSATCSQVTSATGNTPGCSSSTCVYGIQYGDSSFSVGFLGTEKLSLTPTDVFNNFVFGCGQNNRGLFGGSAGLIGLGRDKLSIVEQTAAKYGRYFSYCLPSSSSSTGHLTFGNSGGGALKFTPLSTISRGGSFYGITIQGISIGGQKVSIPASIFSNAPAIIDSGTVISRLPPTAYSALRDAFKKFMSSYPTAPSLSILDTCYDFSKYSSVTVPKIGFTFSGAGEVLLGAKNILYVASVSQVCLAFAANSADTDILIYGNVQQLSFQVAYDVGGLKLGFGAGGCA